MPIDVRAPPSKVESAEQKISYEHVQSVLQNISQLFGFVYAEALHPRSDGHCLCQSGAKYCSNEDVEHFSSASREFVFPLQTGIPGRVWKYKNLAWHSDVSILPSTIYLRSELAKQARLRGCVALPMQVSSSAHFYVVLFYRNETILSESFPLEVMEATRQKLKELPEHNLSIPASTSGAEGQVGSQSVLSKSRSWLKCELALNKLPGARTNDDVDDIMKFTRRLEFFKHMPEPQRVTLCRSMSLARYGAGTIMHRSNDPPNRKLWRLVVLGRMAVQVTEMHHDNSPYTVWHFDGGQTFAQSYLSLFSSEANGLKAIIESVTACQCIEIVIPPEMEGEFKACTRPLWYEELTRYFSVSINEAGEALGMCTSAIKKICRRHGITRWPHRKLASVEKTILSIQSKIDEMELTSNKDEGVLCALRTEIFDAIRNKMACGPTSRNVLSYEGAAGGDVRGGGGPRRDKTLNKIDEFDNDDDEMNDETLTLSLADVKMETSDSRVTKERSGDAAVSPTQTNWERDKSSNSPQAFTPAYEGNHPAEFGIMQHQLMGGGGESFGEILSPKPGSRNSDGRSLSPHGVSPLGDDGTFALTSCALAHEVGSRGMIKISQASAQALECVFGVAGLGTAWYDRNRRHEGNDELEGPDRKRVVLATDRRRNSFDSSVPDFGNQRLSTSPEFGRSNSDETDLRKMLAKTDKASYALLANSLLSCRAFGADVDNFSKVGVLNGADAKASYDVPRMIVKRATVPVNVIFAMKDWNADRLVKGLDPVSMEFA